MIYFAGLFSTVPFEIQTVPGRRAICSTPLGRHSISFWPLTYSDPNVFLLFFFDILYHIYTEFGDLYLCVQGAGCESEKKLKIIDPLPFMNLWVRCCMVRFFSVGFFWRQVVDKSWPQAEGCVWRSLFFLVTVLNLIFFLNKGRHFKGSQSGLGDLPPERLCVSKFSISNYSNSSEWHDNGIRKQFKIEGHKKGNSSQI